MAANASNIKAGGAYVELSAKDGKLSAGLKSAEAKLARFGAATKLLQVKLNSISRGFAATAQGINNVSNGLMSAGGKIFGVATLMGGALGYAVKQAMDLGEQLDKMSARTGASVEWLSAMRYAADMSGATIEDVENALKGMNETLAEASIGRGRGLVWLKELGIDLADLEGLSTEQKFEKFADSISKVEDAAKRTKYATALFRGGGEKLLPMIGNAEYALTFDDSILSKRKSVGIDGQLNVEKPEELSTVITGKLNVEKPENLTAEIDGKLNIEKPENLTAEIDGKLNIEKPDDLSVGIDGKLSVDQKNVLDSLKELGLDANKLFKLTPEVRLAKVRRALATVDNEQKRKKLTKTLITQKPGSIDQLKGEAKQLGLIVSTEQSKNAAALNDALGRLKMTMQMLVVSVGNALTPSLRVVADEIATLIPKISDFIDENKGTIVSLAKLIPILAGVGVGIISLGVLLKPVSWIFSILSVGALGLSKSIGFAVGSFKLLYTSVRLISSGIGNTFTFSVKLFRKLFSALVAIESVFHKIGVAISSISFKGVSAGLSLVSKSFGFLKVIIGGIVPPIIKVIKGIIPAIIKVIKGIIPAIKGIIPGIIKVIKGIITSIKDLFIMLEYVWTNFILVFRGFIANLGKLKVLGVLKTWLSIIGAAIHSLGGAILSVVLTLWSPITLIVVGLAGVAGVALLIYKNWGAIPGFFRNLFDGIGRVVTLFVRYVIDAFKQLVVRIKQLVVAISEIVKNTALSIVGFFKSAFDKITGIFTGFFARLSDNFAKLKGFAKESIDLMVSAFEAGNLSDSFKIGFSSIKVIGLEAMLFLIQEVSNALGVFRDVWYDTINGIKNTWTRMSTSLAMVWVTMIEGFSEQIITYKHFVDTVIDILNDAMNNRINLSSFIKRMTQVYVKLFALIPKIRLQMEKALFGWAMGDIIDKQLAGVEIIEKTIITGIENISSDADKDYFEQKEKELQDKLAANKKKYDDWLASLQANESEAIAAREAERNAGTLVFGVQIKGMKETLDEARKELEEQIKEVRAKIAAGKNDPGENLPKNLDAIMGSFQLRDLSFFGGDKNNDMTTHQKMQNELTKRTNRILEGIAARRQGLSFL